MINVYVMKDIKLFTEKLQGNECVKSYVHDMSKTLMNLKRPKVKPFSETQTNKNTTSKNFLRMFVITYSFL